MASKFLIRIEDVAKGQIALLTPGGKGERDLVEAIVAATLSKGVGVFKTEIAVERAIREGAIEVLSALKSEVVPQ
jgi:hypothetical protein